jgi:hypothetical protein
MPFRIAAPSAIGEQSTKSIIVTGPVSLILAFDRVPAPEYFIGDASDRFAYEGVHGPALQEWGLVSNELQRIDLTRPSLMGDRPE